MSVSLPNVDEDDPVGAAGAPDNLDRVVGSAAPAARSWRGRFASSQFVVVPLAIGLSIVGSPQTPPSEFGDLGSLEPLRLVGVLAGLEAASALLAWKRGRKPEEVSPMVAVGIVLALAASLSLVAAKAFPGCETALADASVMPVPAGFVVLEDHRSLGRDHVTRSLLVRHATLPVHDAISALEDEYTGRGWGLRPLGDGWPLGFSAQQGGSALDIRPRYEDGLPRRPAPGREIEITLWGQYSGACIS